MESDPKAIAEESADNSQMTGAFNDSNCSHYMSEKNSPTN